MRTFSAHDIPHIDSGYVTSMQHDGYAIARGVIRPDLYIPIANAAPCLTTRRLDLSSEPSRISRTPVEAYMVALAVHEAFFQAGLTDWKPNLSVILERANENPHADMPIYKIGVALAYTSGNLDMQVASSLKGLESPRIIRDIQAGDVLFLSALALGDEPSNDAPDGRTWHNAVGGHRTMLHMGYEL